MSFLLTPFLFLAAFLLSYFGVAMVRKLGIRNKSFAHPNARSLHTEPVPFGGGLVIAVICLVTYLPISLFSLHSFSWGYFAGACLITLVSYLDDHGHVGFPVRLFVHSIAAILLIVDLDTWHGITMLGGLQMGKWAYLITFVWIVWMVNAYNFMDGIDGLAGIQSILAAAGWLLLGLILNMPALFLFSGMIGAASLGFLIHNWPPARIFMGDVGSAFLGYTFAALPLLARHMASKAWDLLPLAALLFVWFFVFDSVFTLFRRLLRRENIFLAHREHLFQRLVSSGLSHERVTLLYALLSIILAASAILSVAYREEIGLPMFPVVGALTLVLLGMCAKRGVLLRHV